MNMCSICFEETNDGITCKHCNEYACLECEKKWFLECGDDLLCFSCNKEWDFSILYTKFDTKYIKEWTNVKKKFLFDKEKNIMRENMNLAEIRQKTLQKENSIMELEKQKSILFEKIKKYSLKSIMDIKYKSKLNKCRNEVNEIDSKIKYIENPEKYNELKKSKKSKELNKRFVFACPADGCRGFLDDTFYCCLCKKITCPECMQIKKDDSTHVCKKEDIESTNLIRADSKPCPGCSSLIFRIQGCDFMYCPQCHANFNWISGKIYNIRKRVSADPHAAWAEPEIVSKPVVATLNQEKIIKKSILDELNGDQYTRFSPIHYIIKIEIPTRINKYNEYLNSKDNNVYITNTRTKYLTNEINDEEFKTKLFNVYKKIYVFEKSLEYCRKFLEKANKIWNKLKKSCDFDKIFKQFDQERIILNENMIILSKILKCKTFQINEHFTII